MRHRLRAAGAAVAAAVAVAVAVPPASADSVFIEGDSLTVGASAAIKRHLRTDFREITVDAQVGRNTPTGISRLSAGRNASVWVVALGTNDAPSPASMRHHVRTVLKRAGQRPVLWVSVWRSPAYSKVNAMLSRLDAGSSQLSVLRWDQYIRANRGLLASDRIHLTPAGYEVRGRLIAEAVRALLSER